MIYFYRKYFLFKMCLAKFWKRLLPSSYLSIRLYECPSVCPHETTRLPLEGLLLNLMLVYFSKIYRENSSFIKIWQNNGYFTWRPIYILTIPRAILRRMRSISDKSFRENHKIHFMYNHVFRKSCRLWDNVEKQCRTGKATDDNMAHAHCMLDK